MNLFDITPGFKGNKNDKPRTANDDEIFAYAHWLRTSRCLPNFPGATLRWRSHARGADPVCVAVTFGGDKEPGAYSLLLPGYASHRDRVTFETLADDGEPETSQTLPVEPKKGGVIWDKAAVHKAHGPIAKPAKVKRGAKVAEPEAAPMATIASPEPAQDESAPIAAQDKGSLRYRPMTDPELPSGHCWHETYFVRTGETDLDMLTKDGARWRCEASNLERGRASPARTAPVQEPEIVPAELSETIGQLPAAPVANLDAITARLDALEQALATLSAVQEATVGAQAPSATETEIAPDLSTKRSPAHERAIRRAWQERAARRAATALAAVYVRNIERTVAERDRLADDLAVARQDVGEVTRHAEMMARRGNQHRDRRLASARRARRMIGAVRARADLDRRALEITNATVARLKRDMADTIQPERASDIARLVQERDQARTALAAMAARAERAEQGVHAMADRFEGLVSRVAKAEAALRQSQAA